MALFKFLIQYNLYPIKFQHLIFPAKFNQKFSLVWLANHDPWKLSIQRSNLGGPSPRGSTKTHSCIIKSSHRKRNIKARRNPPRGFAWWGKYHAPIMCRGNYVRQLFSPLFSLYRFSFPSGNNMKRVKDPFDTVSATMYQVSLRVHKSYSIRPFCDSLAAEQQPEAI